VKSRNFEPIEYARLLALELFRQYLETVNEFEITCETRTPEPTGINEIELPEGPKKIFHFEGRAK
jgi:hypothetical protein